MSYKICFLNLVSSNRLVVLEDPDKRMQRYQIWTLLNQKILLRMCVWVTKLRSCAQLSPNLDCVPLFKSVSWQTFLANFCLRDTCVTGIFSILTMTRRTSELLTIHQWLTFKLTSYFSSFLTLIVLISFSLSFFFYFNFLSCLMMKFLLSIFSLWYLRVMAICIYFFFPVLIVIYRLFIFNFFFLSGFKPLCFFFSIMLHGQYYHFSLLRNNILYSLFLS